jgi:hypothetical protein
MDGAHGEARVLNSGAPIKDKEPFLPDLMLEPTLIRGQDSPKPGAIPSDVEREIFERTARLYPGAAPILLRVSQRVFAWYGLIIGVKYRLDQLFCCRIEPIVYETLIVQISEPSWALHPSLLQALKSKPSSFKKNVRNLLLDCPDLCPPDVVRNVKDYSDLVLSTCRGVHNLIIPVPTPFMIPHLESMKLQRLHITLRNLSWFYTADFTFSFLTTVTHLELFEPIVHSRSLEYLPVASLPQLTHLRLFNAPRTLLCSVLLAATKLQVFILKVSSRSWEQVCRELSIEDQRLVLMEGEWESGTRGESDFWAHADLFVVKRRNGEIQPGVWHSPE